jgi:hypothetical protein
MAFGDIARNPSFARKPLTARELGLVPDQPAQRAAGTVRDYTPATPGQRTSMRAALFRKATDKALAVGRPMQSVRAAIATFPPATAQLMKGCAAIASPAQADWLCICLVPALDDLHLMQGWFDLEGYKGLYQGTRTRLTRCVQDLETCLGFAESYLWHHPGPYDVSRHTSPTTPEG